MKRPGYPTSGPPDLDPLIYEDGHYKRLVPPGEAAAAGCDLLSTPLTDTGRPSVYCTTFEKSPLLNAPLLAMIPPWTVTWNAPLKGLARVIVTVWARAP